MTPSADACINFKEKGKGEKVKVFAGGLSLRNKNLFLQGIRMKKLNQYLNHVYQKLGVLGTFFVMLPIVFWVWLPAQEPFISVFNGNVLRYVVSGKLFSEKFNIVHAGFALDQPTIGKWLFWFSVMTLSSLPYMAAVRWLSNRNRTTVCWVYGLLSVLVCVMLLCILSWPLCWLIQYVHSMGFTPKRIGGLVYGIVGMFIVIGFIFWANRRVGYVHPTGKPE